MIILLSPAKTLDYETPINDVSHSIPSFLPKSKDLIKTLKDKKPEEISSELFGKHKIHTVAINWENIHGVRVTPNVYTSLKDLDKLASALKKMAI